MSDLLNAQQGLNLSLIWQRLQRNPRRSARKIARDMGILPRSVRRILKTKLHTKPYKLRKVQDLTARQKNVRLQRAKLLKRRNAGGDLGDIVFSDEKLFTIQQSYNNQNDRIWVKNKAACDSELFRGKRKQGAQSIMVWAGITETGRTPLVFVPAGVDINTEVYVESILRTSLLP